MAELTKEERARIEHEALGMLAAHGIVPQYHGIVIQSGTLGIRQLGLVDFLSSQGHRVRWTHKENKR